MNILLLRDSKGEFDPYHHALKEIGNVESTPVLSFDFIDKEQLCESLTLADKFDSIVFTSANAVKAVISCIINDGIVANIDSWKRKQCFVVGKATEKCARQLGFECFGSSCGNAKELAEYIIREKSSLPENPILFPCGQMKRETLPKLLHDAGISLQILTVYETTEHPDILKSIMNYRSRSSGAIIIVFFSPSGVQFSLNKFKEVYKSDFAELHICAIGNTTEEALKAAGHPPSCVAASPSPEGLLTSLRSYVKSIS